MSNKEVLQFLLVKEQEMVNRFHGVISEIIRIENDNERVKRKARELIDSIEYVADDMRRILNR